MNPYEIAQSIGSTATAIGVLFAAWQLRMTKKQAMTQFEDDLAQEYRMLAKQLPVRALLGQHLDPQEIEIALKHFFRYIDLTNEQIFLRMHRRISKETWDNWKDGIKANLSRPAFKEAWNTIAK